MSSVVLTLLLLSATQTASPTDPPPPVDPDPAASNPADVTRAVTTPAEEFQSDPFQSATETLRFSFDASEDLDGDGELDPGEDTNGNGILDPGDDLDVDGLPDDWVRRRGTGFPQYVRCTIDPEYGHEGDQSLHVEINGGRLTYYSPFNTRLGRIDPAFNYVFRGHVRTVGLRHDAAVLSVSFLNARRQRLQRFRTQAVSGTHAGWVELKLGPLEPLPEVRFVVIGCHVTHGAEQDIRGDVWFDSLWMGRLPRLSLINDPRDHYLTPDGPLWPERGNAAAAVSRSGQTRQSRGLPEKQTPQNTGQVEAARAPESLVAHVTGLEPGFDYTLFMSLEDVAGNVLKKRTWPMRAPVSADGADGNGNGKSGAESGQVDVVRWNVAPRESGCYFVKAHLSRGSDRTLLRETTIAVVEPSRARTSGEFGWSMTSGYGELEPEDVIHLLGEAGINAVKLPLWKSMNGEGPASPEDLSRILDGLASRSISVVGLLNDPPSSIRDLFGDRFSGVRQIFDLDRDFWGPSLEPVLARYGSTVEYWQLGGEDDHSFVGWPRLAESVKSIKADFDRIGRNSQIGVQWPWPTADQPVPIDIRDLFVTVGGPDGLSVESVAEAFDDSVTVGPTKRWALIQPLSNEHPHEDRASDLVERMIAARLAGAKHIYLTDPLDPHHGVLKRDGAPAPLFLPWRTAATLLRGTEYLGSFRLPGKPVNHVLQRDGAVTVVFLGTTPGSASLNLGDRVERVDIWGRRQSFPVLNGRQQISIGTVPVFCTGCSEPLARWRLETGFENGRIPSVLGQHQDAIIVHNTFNQGIRGTVRLNTPPDWTLERDSWPLELAAGETVKLPVAITLPATESLGTSNAVISFEIESDRRHSFDVYRSFEVGLGDILVDLLTRPLDDGRLEIEQIVTNKTNGDPISFRCTLSVSGHRSQTRYVTRLGADQDRKLYYLPNAEALQGRELWLNLEEIGGRRNLNKRLIIGEDW